MDLAATTAARAPTGTATTTVDRTVDRTVAAVVLDWDGTAVPDRQASAALVRHRIERLSRLGVHVAVVSGTHVGNVDGQLGARPAGPGELLLALNRGSELYVVTRRGPRLLLRREEDPATTRLLDEATAAVVDELRRRGLDVTVVSSRLNRRKVDLVPEPAWADPPKSRLPELLRAVECRLRPAGIGSLAEVVALTERVAREHGLADARVTSDAKHVEVGVTDKSDSMRAVMSRLARHGVTGELVLVVGDELGDLGGLPGSDAAMLVPEAHGALVVSVGPEPAGVRPPVRHLGGGPQTLVRLLDEQVRRARRLRVPEVSHDPRWTVVERGPDPARHRVTESLFTLTSGGVGLRGSVEETTGLGNPLVVADGVYRGTGADDGLLPGPDLVDVRLTPGVDDDVRVLDLRTGVLHRREASADGLPLRSVRFGSIVEPGVLAMRAEAARGRLHSPPADPGASWSETSGGAGGIGALVRQSRARDGDVSTVERVAALDWRPRGVPSTSRAAARLARASRTGFDALLAGQRTAWSGRWERVDVRIPDDPATELGLRLALFHLWGLASGDPEVAVGARALTGSGYAGHVFWDADVFVLPAMVSIDPATAEAMVRYRLRRLDAARERARAAGHAGARYPWESALTGHDVTPSRGWVGGEPVPILTGDLEEHVTADVAWAVVRNAAWTRPGGRLRPAERVLLAETARYWASRATTDARGAAHVEGVIGPDEYHERVDDNAFTNAMVRWNLRSAARWAQAPVAERRPWRHLADRLVDGYDASRGLHEQFRGYLDLEPLTMADLAEPPVAADVLAGRERIAASQVVKQPDVVMLHLLVPEEAARGSLVRDVDFYAPRTAHGSSLSPATMAQAHARAGHPDAALDLLRLSLRIDLDDLGGTTAAGVHIGAFGAAWQAVLHGFLGAREVAGALRLDPVLPREWSSLEVRFGFLGRDVVVGVDHDRLSVRASAPLTVRVPASGPRVSAGDHVRLLVEGGTP